VSSPTTRTREDAINAYVHRAAIDNFFVALLQTEDDVSSFEPVFTKRKLFGSDEELADTAAENGLNLATKLWAELWPGDDETPEMESADARAALLTSELFARLLENLPFLAEQAASFAAAAWAGGETS